MSLYDELAVAMTAGGRDAPGFHFESWALRIFRHQYERNAPYSGFCDRRGVRPDTVARWQDVPPVPTAAFRHADLTCGPAVVVFRTSGTTAGPAARGRHLVTDLGLYRTSALTTFERFVLPDGARLPCLFLLPPPDVRPDSSLVRMCAWVGEQLGTSTEWFAGPNGLDVEQLVARLDELGIQHGGVLLAGPTAGFVRLFDTGRTFHLGPATRVMDTGGQKGMPRALSRPGFLRACWTHLGVAGYCCVNEYGMTELCSQRYDGVLWERLHGRNLAPRRLLAPPWLRTRVVDPDTLTDVAPGATGLLCHHDLANAGSVSVVLTEDLGRTVGDDGIEVLGRVTGAVPRGCGLLLADLAGQ